LFTMGGSTMDIIAILIAGGSGIVTTKSIQAAQAKFPTSGR